MNLLCLNGSFLPADQPVLQANNRGFRYGDGLFETMRMVNGSIPLWDLHFHRLISGMGLFKLPPPLRFEESYLLNLILTLCRQNGVATNAKLRFSVFRGNGDLQSPDDYSQFLIEATAIEPFFRQLPVSGLSIDIYMEGKKNLDGFSNLKSSNFHPYLMASLYSREIGCDDCLVLNAKGHIADSTIANVFLIRKGLIITPSLAEGGIAGVMRMYLLEKLRSMPTGYEVREGVVTKSDLDVFDEVFLTNAVQGLRWVERYRDKVYSNEAGSRIFQSIVRPLFE